jgi:tryptophanyl-tRNA synthetase
MSKSGDSPAGILWLMDDPAVLTKKIKSAVTDTETEIRFDQARKPGVSNLLTLLSIATDRTVDSWVEELSGGGYGTLKTTAAEAIVELLAPMKKQTEELLRDEAELDRMLFAGAEKAAHVASKTLARVHNALGFVSSSRPPIA